MPLWLAKKTWHARQLVFSFPAVFCLYKDERLPRPWAGEEIGYGACIEKSMMFSHSTRGTGCLSSPFGPSSNFRLFRDHEPRRAGDVLQDRLGNRARGSSGSELRFGWETDARSASQGFLPRISGVPPSALGRLDSGKKLRPRPGCSFRKAGTGVLDHLSMPGLSQTQVKCEDSEGLMAF